MAVLQNMTANNAINTDSKKRRSFVGGPFLLPVMANVRHMGNEKLS